MDDEDDAFLYGDSGTSAPAPAPILSTAAGTGEDVLDFELDEPSYETPPRTNEALSEVAVAPAGLGLPGEQLQERPEYPVQPEGSNKDEDEEEEEEEEEESEDDIEIITEPPTRSIDFRAVRGPGGVPQQPPRAPLPPSQTRPVHLTTEYTIKARPAETGQTPGLAPAPAPIPVSTSSVPSSTTQQPPDHQSSQGPSQNQTPQPQQIQPLPELLPDPVRAPASHPSLDISAPGVLVVPGALQARPVWEVDLDSLSTKSWRRPGANLSDWFNYGFDEISWEAYCMRRKELGETAAGMKANVLNVAGLPEDQLLNLPPDMRSVVLGTAAMLPLPGQGGPGPNMMMPPNAGGPAGVNGKRMVSGPGPGPGMGGPQGMGMGGPQPMGPGMGGPGMGMSGPKMGPGPGVGMGVPGGMGGPGMGVPGGPGGVGGMGGPMGMMGGPGPNMLGMNMMNMPPEMMMQMQQGMGMMNGHAGQEEYDDDGNIVTEKVPEKEQKDDKSQDQETPGKVESPSEPAQEPSLTPTPNDPPVRGGFRGRAAAARARGFAARGRGRGGFHSDVAAPRPASPLPPNVPTGPRNPNTRSYKDKDRDGDSKVEGLDYGGDLGTETVTVIETGSTATATVIETVTVIVSTETGTTGIEIGIETAIGASGTETATVIEGRARTDVGLVKRLGQDERGHIHGRATKAAGVRSAVDMRHGLLIPICSSPAYLCE
ncbi:FIP1 motif protein [Ceratobasidium sp. AG-Ba]|nr:FIP1 motif protein [Ceratobasidium sp. AG-Ba]QRW08942.1 FIP1 motif protein [Ceratobasidium sp. AG-Ba]